MPFYQFTVPTNGPSAKHKADIAAAVTKVHTSVTGAPESYVNVSFTEVSPGSIFAAGKVVPYGRMVGLIRSGRTQEDKRRLIKTNWRRPGVRSPGSRWRGLRYSSKRSREAP